MDAMPTLGKAAFAYEDRLPPPRMSSTGAVEKAKAAGFDIKKRTQTGRPRSKNGMTAMSTNSGTQPARAPLERGFKGQMLIVQDDVQRIVGALAALARSGDIDQAQSSAAERWYRDYVMGVVGARDPEGGRSGRAPDIHASMLARSAAVGRCRMVRNGLGFCGEVRLRLLLIDELSFSAIAAKLLPDDVNGRKKIAAQMALLLEQLSELYMTLDQRLGR